MRNCLSLSSIYLIQLPSSCLIVCLMSRARCETNDLALLRHSHRCYRCCTHSELFPTPSVRSLSVFCLRCCLRYVFCPSVTIFSTLILVLLF